MTLLHCCNCRLSHQDYSDWIRLIMEETLNSTVSFTNNTSNESELYGNGTNLTVTEESVTEDQAKLAEIARQMQLWEIVVLMQVYRHPPIIVLGTLGNVLAFIVMRRGSMRHVSTCFYMAILALADTGNSHFDLSYFTFLDSE